ncbi:MAG: YfhO family protein [Vicinamibacterales bacterium]
MKRAPLAGLVACVALLVIGCGALFDRTWRYGEVLSPADVLESFFPWAADGPRHEPSNATRSDEAFYHQPLMMTHWPRLSAGEFPYWDPFVLSGTPSFQQGLDVARALSPTSLPFYVFDPATAVTLYGPLRLLCAGLLMWWYLRAAGLAVSASATGAVLFAFNGAFIVWLTAPMPTVALWLPLIALGIERVVQRGRPTDAALLAAGIGCQFLGGYLPTSLVVVTVGGVWAVGWLIPNGKRERPVAVRRTLVLLGCAGTAGLALAAGGLVPMLVTLSDSPANARSMQDVTLPWQNAATFALPDFWGTPLQRNWWSPFGGNYPEFVTYTGVLAVALAAAAITVTARERNRRAVLAVAIAVLCLMQMYGVPPVSWLGALPGFHQMNPYRWNVGLVFGTAILAAVAVDDRLRDAGREPSQRWRNRLAVLMAALLGIALLAAVAAWALFDQFDRIRALNLQAFEKANVAAFLAVCAASFVVVAGLTVGSRRVRQVSAWGAAILAAVDLVHAAHGFNPTMARERLYPSTPGIAFLQRHIGTGRIAPVGESYLLPESHVWGIYGVPSTVGFDFFGAADYQAFLARSGGQPSRSARWGYVGLESDRALNLRLLGLLGVELIVTPPLDSWTHAPGYTTVGEITAERSIAQTFTVRYDGLRRLDLLVATFGRVNSGRWDIDLVDVEHDVLISTWRRDAASLPDVDWLRLNLPPQMDSAGRRYRLEIRAPGAARGRGATLLATPEGGLPDASLTIDGSADSRALWIRAFSTAPERIRGAVLEYARDLNVYRNPLAMPRAWFVQRTETVPAAEQLDALAGVDLGTTAVTEPLQRSASDAPARISLVGEAGDERRYDVQALAGGVVVFSERFDRSWTLATENGQPLPLVRANSVLMAAAVPPGTTRLTLTYSRPDWTAAAFLSMVSLAGIVIAASRPRWMRFGH